MNADVVAAVHAVLGELQPKASARDVCLEEMARNPKWREAPKTGQAFGILGYRAKP